MNKDLTVGNPRSVLWRFSLPMFGSIIFQQLYNIADSLVAGKFVGENALAAVGNAYEITLIFIAFAFGCNIGCSVVVSRLFGSKEWGEMKSAVTTTFLASVVLCLVLMGLGFWLCPALLHLINTPEEIFADSLLYMNIYIGGLPFLFLYNVATGIFSAMGDSRTPFFFLAASSTANIFMDILFVTSFGMAVDGVAWATFLCQGVSCVLAVWAVARRMQGIPTPEKPALFSWRMLGKIAVIAVPSILQQSSVSVGNIIIQSVINSFGASVIAGYSAAIKLNNLVITSFTTLANGISNYTSQNLGAAKPERVRQGYLAGVKLVWLICVPLAAAYFFAGRQLLFLFMNEPTGTAIETGILFLRIVAPFYFVVSLKLVSDGVLRGCSLMVQFMAATFADLILRVALSVGLSATSLGSTGIWLSWPIGWVIGTGLSLLFCLRAVGRARALETGEEPLPSAPAGEEA